MCLQGWFSDKVSTAIEESRTVALAYLVEHQDTIANDVGDMAEVLNYEGAALITRPRRFQQLLDDMAWGRSLTEAMVFQRDPFQVLARERFSLSLALDPDISDEDYSKARAGQRVLQLPGEGDRVRALMLLESFPPRPISTSAD